MKKAAVPKQLRGAQAREKLISAALDLFGEMGFDGAGTRDIAARAGQNIAAITYYFGSKDGLYSAVLQECLRQKNNEAESSIRTANALLANPHTAPDEYLAAIKTWLRARVLALAQENRRARSFMKLMFREQFSPTKTFKTFYRTSAVSSRDPFTLLVAAYLGRDPQAVETVLIVHALAGPYIGFLVSPEIVRIKAGWKKIGVPEATQIADILTAQMEASLKSLRASGARS